MTKEDALRAYYTHRDNDTWYSYSFEYAIIEIFDSFDFEMEAYRQCEEQLKNCETALDEALERVKELEHTKHLPCNGCKWDYELYDIDPLTGYRRTDIFPEICYTCKRNFTDSYEPAIT